MNQNAKSNPASLSKVVIVTKKVAVFDNDKKLLITALSTLDAQLL